MAYDVVIVGAGAEGLSSAFHLARAGVKVAVIEREQPGCQASGAAAGNLSPLMEVQQNEPYLQLLIRSRNLWPAFAAAIRELSGVDPELIPSGVLEVPRDDAHAEELRRYAERRRALGQEAEWLSPDELAQRLPGLALPNRGALHAPADLTIQPARAVTAAYGACSALGVQFYLGQEVQRLLIEGGRATGVETARGRVTAGSVVIAGGAFSGMLATAGLHLPIAPVKGQMLALQVAGRLAGPWLTARSPLFLPGVYLVPKRDGRLFLGATEEPEAGFDRSVTLDGLLKLAGAAVRAFPALAQAPIVDFWSGLRPGSPDRMALLGPAPGIEGLIIATGHDRNGMLLAPLTGQAVAAWAQGKAPETDLQILSPKRFTH